jgi:hypothetical protein
VNIGDERLWEPHYALVQGLDKWRDTGSTDAVSAAGKIDMLQSSMLDHPIEECSYFARLHGVSGARIYLNRFKSKDVTVVKLE